MTAFRQTALSLSVAALRPDAPEISGHSGTRYLSQLRDTTPYVGIDWITCKIPIPNDFPDVQGGTLLCLTPDGQIEWQVRKKLQAEGSFSSSVAIRTGLGWSVDQQRVLEVSGNPSKTLTGHNVWAVPGTDLRSLVDLWVNTLLASAGLPVLRVEEAKLSRVDLCAMIHVGDQADAEAVLHSLATQAYVSFRGRGVRRQNTCYWGQNSKHWSLKAYLKHVEMQSREKGHKLPEILGDDLRAQLLDAAVGTVRIELQMARLGLQHVEREWLSAWSATTPWDLWNSKMENVKLSGQVTLQHATVDSLPRSLQAAYLKWETGYDFSANFSGPGRATWYRHRKALRDLVGVDISIPKDQQQSKIRVSLQRVVSLRPSAPPPWIWDHVRLAA